MKEFICIVCPKGCHLKVSEESFFELHIDTDDANAHLIKNGDIGEIV